VQFTLVWTGISGDFCGITNDRSPNTCGGQHGSGATVSQSWKSYKVIKRFLVSLFKSLIAKVFKRQVVFITGDYEGLSPSKALLPLLYTYRASAEGLVTYQVQESGTDLRYALYSVALSGTQPIPGQLCFRFRLPSIERGDVLCINLVSPSVWINDKPINLAPNDYQKTRKYIADLQLKKGSTSLTRSLFHYLPFEGKPIGKDYYYGDDYTEYPLHTNAAHALRLVRQFCTSGRLLDIGCALGIYTKAFLDAGFDAYGIDISEFAIEEARKKVGSGRLFRCNLDNSDIPFCSEFDVFWMWDVLEHSDDPQQMLAKVTKKATRGAWLFLHTANRDSLTHRVLGSDWEGYSDYSHLGIDLVSASSLSKWLHEQGWEIVRWECSNVWVSGCDPVLLRLRDAFLQIPGLSTFLSERNLGDAILVVARKL
jgi:SAM-dependent methyltransferase